MFSQQLCLFTLLAAANAVPAQWRRATVKRGIFDLAEEYDYIIGMAL